MNRRKARKIARWNAAEEMDQLFEWTAACSREDVCPKCEVRARFEPAIPEMVPPAILTQYVQGTATDWEINAMHHRSDCPLAGAHERLIEILEQFGFKYRASLMTRLTPDGSAGQSFQRYWRIPGRNDLPVAPEYTRS